MEIKIQDDYYITSNKWSYKLAKKEFNEDGKMKWKHLRHRSTIAGVLDEFCELQIKTMHATEFEKVIEKVKKLKALINDIQKN
ncbi:MAG: hypothetical protein ACOCRX_07060 [Candidatus Woesearchaeota archaeon]